jgi:hypothetical protein
VSARDERPLRAVPRPLLATLAAALALQIAWQAAQPKPVASARALPAPPTVAALRIASLGEPLPLAQMMMLYLQAFDNQPGISIPFRELDYGRVIEWLAAALALDARASYPLLVASQVYAQVPDEARTRMMFEFVYRQFLRDPDRRWRWLAHAALVAKHRLKDQSLALFYAREIARLAPAAPGWARQMHIFILEDLGEIESAKILLGALLSTGEISDEHELHFLTGRLQAMQNAGKSTPATNN